MALPPAAVISAASASSTCRERATSTTGSPSRAAIRAISRPIPDDAPVTTMAGFIAKCLTKPDLCRAFDR